MDTIVRFFQEGGSFMFPISVVLAIGLAIALERYWFLGAAKRTNKKAFREIEPLLASSNFDRIIQVTQNSTAPIARVIGAGITRLGVSPRREDIEYAMEEGLMETIPRLEKRTQYLGMLANISTLLGLLGTIIGLIAAFSAVARESELVVTKYLSGDEHDCIRSNSCNSITITTFFVEYKNG